MGVVAPGEKKEKITKLHGRCLTYLLILKCFSNSTFFNVVCMSWIFKVPNNAKNILWCPVIREITVLIFRTFSFPEIKMCETTDELRWVIMLWLYTVCALKGYKCGVRRK